ncbi:MAG: hypothetical protein AB1644_08665 [Candidatus Zixiibacteriota bacterium]
MRAKMCIASATLAALIVAGLVSGCIHTLQAVPASRLRQTDSGKMELLMKDGTTYRLDRGTVTAKRITGYGLRFPHDSAGKFFSGSIPISDVSIVQTNKIDPAVNLLAWGCIGFLTASAAQSLGSGSFGVVGVEISYPVSGGGGGSCPYVFSYDGKSYQFESETFAGSVCRGLERTVVEPLAHLTIVDGAYRLALANQSPESQHVNELALLAADHPYGTRIIPDIRNILHTVQDVHGPTMAVGLDGSPAAHEIRAQDGRFWETRQMDIDSSITRLRDGLICEFEKPETATAAKLVVTARATNLGYFALEKLFSLRGPGKLDWYHELNTDSLERRRLVNWLLREGGLQVSVWMDGRWVTQGVLPPIGPRSTVTNLAVLNLADVAGATVRVKLESCADLWRLDHVGIDFGPDESIMVTPARLASATSETGTDVMLKLVSNDTLYYSTAPGNYAQLRYDTVALAEGMSRTMLLRATGHYYSWLDADSVDSQPLVERILDEPQFGSMLYFAEWLKVRDTYQAVSEQRPRFAQH